MGPNKIVGEGTYGCVAKPSLTCQGPALNYKNKISKIMLTDYAISEYNEMKAITKLNGIDKYIVSLPDMCIPVADSNFRVTIKDCENEKFKKALDGDFRLLVYEDGGLSLKQFTTDMLPLLSTSDIHIFLTKIHHLLEGLCFLNKNDIVHHDIKSRNIVYNVETNVMKFIDFGLVKKRSQLITESKNSLNRMAQKWDNFPPEYDRANKNDYMAHPLKMEYDVFLERLGYTFDSYSFGKMMKSVIADILPYSENIYMEGLKQIFYFFNEMSNEDIASRDYDIFTFPDKYEKILKKFNMWNTNVGKPSSQSIELQQNLNKIMDMSTQEMSTLTQALSPFSNLKPCPETKERNPKTKRCIAKCKDGWSRNDKFMCRKTRKCADTKERNPISKRCVKKCKVGFVRNDKFKCKRQKF